MQSYTRHQLKEDKFQEATRSAIEQAQAHRQQLIVGAIAIIALVLVAGGFGMWRSSQQDKASVALGEAMTTYSAPLRPAGSPAEPNMLSFTSSQERDKQAEAQFDNVARQYPHTDAGKNALYMAGAAALDAGQYSDAEGKFKQVAGSGDKELASLAKMGLASVYESTNRDKDAIDIYNELMKKPTVSVSREQAQFALAALYEHKDPSQAKKIYDELANDKSPAVAQIAKQRESALGK